MTFDFNLYYDLISSNFVMACNLIETSLNSMLTVNVSFVKMLSVDIVVLFILKIVKYTCA